MKNYLSNLDYKHLRFIREIGKEAEKRRLSAYVVGGIVRDILLKKEILDLDIVVEGDAIHLARILAKKWNKKLTVYKKFGTASLQISDELCVDLATARREHYSRSGALPTVQPGNLSEDLARRDFTINAMAIVINSNCFGQLIDIYGGLKDLSDKKVRILHAQSFIDDPTRILRAVRFEQRLRFQTERQTLLCMKQALKKNILKNIKPSRYLAELKKILSETGPVRCLKRLYDLGGLGFIDPKLTVDIRSLSRIYQNIQKGKRISSFEQNNYWLIYFMALMAKSSDGVVDRVLKKFPFTKGEHTSIRQGRDVADIKKKLSSKALLRSEVYRILHSLNPETILYTRASTIQKTICRRIDRFLSEDTYVQLRINGEDLKRMGIASGRRMGKILEDILYLKIDGRVQTKKEELNAVVLP